MDVAEIVSDDVDSRTPVGGIMRQYLNIFHFRSREVERAYRRYHADVWRQRLRFFLCAHVAISIGRSTQTNVMQSAFRKRMHTEVIDGDMRALDVAMSVLRLGAPTLLAASTYTRFDPTKTSYSLSLLAVGLVHLISLYFPTMYELRHDPEGGDGHSLHPPPEDTAESLLSAGEATAFQAHAAPDQTSGDQSDAATRLMRPRPRRRWRAATCC